MYKSSGSLSIAIVCSCAILSKYLVILPEYVVKYTGNAAWLNIAAKCALAFLSFLVTLWLYKPFAPISLKEIFSLALGRSGKVIFSYIYVIGFTLFNAILLRLLCEALSTVISATAPDEYFAIFILVPVFIAAFSGIRATTNLSTIIFPFVILSLFVVSIALFPHYRVQNIAPVFGIETKRLVNGIFTKHFGFTEIAVLFFLAPFLGSYNKIKTSGILTFAFISVFSIIFTLSYCLIVPYPASTKFFLPFYQMTRIIKSGAFLQRLEPIVVFVWTSFVMCSTSIIISLGSKLLSEKEEHENAFVPVLTIITFFISMLPKSESSAFILYEKLLDYSTFIFPVTTVAILVVARIRQRRKCLK